MASVARGRKTSGPQNIHVVSFTPYLLCHFKLVYLTKTWKQKAFKYEEHLLAEEYKRKLNEWEVEMIRQGKSELIRKGNLIKLKTMLNKSDTADNKKPKRKAKKVTFLFEKYASMIITCQSLFYRLFAYF